MNKSWMEINTQDASAPKEPMTRCYCGAILLSDEAVRNHSHTPKWEIEYDRHYTKSRGKKIVTHKMRKQFFKLTLEKLIDSIPDDEGHLETYQDFRPLKAQLRKDFL